jgi:hypothetical protein
MAAEERARAEAAERRKKKHQAVGNILARTKATTALFATTHSTSDNLPSVP